jgi:hypothetical protein
MIYLFTEKFSLLMSFASAMKRYANCLCPFIKDRLIHPTTARYIIYLLSTACDGIVRVSAYAFRYDGVVSSAHSQPCLSFIEHALYSGRNGHT